MADEEYAVDDFGGHDCIVDLASCVSLISPQRHREHKVFLCELRAFVVNYSSDDVLHRAHVHAKLLRS
jgi:hypothetical protein